MRELIYVALLLLGYCSLQGRLGFRWHHLSPREVLISILIYIFAILLTRTVGFAHRGATEDVDKYFGNLLYSDLAEIGRLGTCCHLIPA